MLFSIPRRRQHRLQNDQGICCLMIMICLLDVTVTIKRKIHIFIYQTLLMSFNDSYTYVYCVYSKDIFVYILTYIGFRFDRHLRTTYTCFMSVHIYYMCNVKLYTLYSFLNNCFTEILIFVCILN